MELELEIPAGNFPPEISSHGEVHVWCVTVDLATPPPGQLVASLSPEEQTRTSRFRFEKDRHRARYSAGMLRCLLSHYTGQPARAVQYTRNEWGKPGLADSSLQFNISHTGSWIAFAFTHHHPLGVDIEQWHAIPEAGDIARNYFAERERTALQSVPDDRRQEAFFNLWTRKEACLKALGAGLNLPLDRFEFTVDPCLPARLVAVNGQAEEAAKWSLFQFAPEPDISGCLAIPVKPVKARGWRLDRDLLVCAKTVTI